jgi:hypothetical protein
MTAEESQNKIRPLLKEHAMKTCFRNAVSVTFTGIRSVYVKLLHRVRLFYKQVAEVHKAQLV